MPPPNIGEQYDKIARWWNSHHIDSGYGVPQVKQALEFTQSTETALDVGCGSGGRLVRLLLERGFDVTGVDASAEMIAITRENHPDSSFHHADIIDWQTKVRYDFILAWDSLFHLPLTKQEPVLRKLCGLLSDGGVLIYTFGENAGEHFDEWRGQEFYYSSIGSQQNINLLHENGLTIKHMAFDQYPENHMFLIARKEYVFPL